MPREADFYTPGEAARLLGLPEFTVLGLLTSGKLEGHQDEQARWGIPAVAVDEAVRRGRDTDAPVGPSAEETIAMPPVSPAGSADEPAGDEPTQFEAVAGSLPRTPSTDDEGEGPTEAPSGDRGGSAGDQGWVTTKVAAEALGVTLRTIHTYVHEGELEGKAEQEGINKRLLVSIASLDELRVRRETEGKFRPQRGHSSGPEKIRGRCCGSDPGFLCPPRGACGGSGIPTYPAWANR